jgi:uncharacterized damage-inducible protein DinB
MIDEIRDLYAYNRWANERTLEAVGSLSGEQLHRPVGGSFADLFQTLVHLYSAEWVWLRRWQGESPTAVADGDLLADLPELRSRWSRVEDERARFLSDLDDPDLTRVIHYSSTAGVGYAAPLGQLLRHVVNHSTYHRGQVTTLLRQLGGTPIATDMVVFHREKARRYRSEKGGGPAASERTS